MAKIGYGYGSEWHLLRYLGYHRNYLNQEIDNQLGLQVIKWLDFNFSGLTERFKLDDEHKGLSFLDEEKHSNVLSDWRDYWPTSGNQQNWDAIGKATSDTEEQWVLVEAKANLEECKSSTQAKPASENGGRDKIIDALQEPIRAFTGSNKTDPEIWLNKYYQYANRLAVLHFLDKQGISASLLFIYFIGDDNKSGNCANSKGVWQQQVKDMHEYLNLNDESDLMNKVKHLYLPVTESFS